MSKRQIRGVRVRCGSANPRVTLIPRRTDSRPGRRNVYLYDVTFNGDVIVANSADPEYDLARALRARGIRDLVEVIDAETGRTRSQVNIQNTARVSVREDRRIGPRSDAWRPLPQIARESVEGRKGRAKLNRRGENRGNANIRPESRLAIQVAPSDGWCNGAHAVKVRAGGPSKTDSAQAVSGIIKVTNGPELPRWRR